MTTFKEFSDSMLVVSDVAKYFEWALGYEVGFIDSPPTQACIYLGQYYILVYPSEDKPTIYRVPIGNTEEDFDNPIDAEKHLWKNFVEAEHGNDPGPST